MQAGKLHCDTPEIYLIATLPPSLNLTLAHSRLAFGSATFIQKLACCSHACNNTERICTPKGDTRNFIFPRVQLAGVLCKRTYKIRENMHANKLEGEARTCIVSYVHLWCIHITRERIWLLCLNKITHSYVAQFYCCIYTHNGNSYIAT